jgi:hypothetical protein
MHINTHSVHKRRLVMRRAHLLCLEAFCYFYPPPLSEANCPPFPPPGGPAPRLPRWLPFPQDPHTLPPHRPLQIVLISFIDGRDDVNHQDNDAKNYHDYDDNAGVEISRLIHSFNPDDLDDDDMKGSP